MRKNNWVGIDIGCTNLKIVSKVDDDLLYPKQYETSDCFTKSDLISIVTDYVNTYHLHLDGLGIAFSGLTSDNVSVYHTTLPCLDDFSTAELSHLDCLNIKLLNDSNAATLAGTIEYPDSIVLVGITNGTGIGCGISINGNLFTGSTGFLGEIYGNYVVTQESSLKKLGKIISGSKIKEQTDAERSNTILYLSSLLTQVINFYNPDVIYFSGGGFEHHLYELRRSIDFAKEYCYKHIIKNLRFELSKFGSFAGAIGAIKFVS